MSDLRPTPPERGRVAGVPIVPVLPDAKPTPVVPPTIMSIPSSVSPTGTPVLPPSIGKWAAPIVLIAGGLLVTKEELLAHGVPTVVFTVAAVIALIIGPALGIVSAGVRK